MDSNKLELLLGQCQHSDWDIYQLMIDSLCLTRIGLDLRQSRFAAQESCCRHDYCRF